MELIISGVVIFLMLGAVGLRSVPGDFNYEVLDYQPRFNRWLQE